MDFIVFGVRFLRELKCILLIKVDDFYTSLEASGQLNLKLLIKEYLF